MNVLLLSSPVVQPDFDRIARVPSLGLAFLAAAVDDLVQLHVADLHALNDPEVYVKRIVNGYDLVGLTAMSYQYHRSGRARKGISLTISSDTRGRPPSGS